MKKLLILSALTLGLCSNVFAYENAANGYSVKEGNPMVVVETADTFAYSNYTAKTSDSILHDKEMETYTSIRTISKKDMSEALGQAFSTDFFNKEINKIVLDKGKNIPEKLTKLANYKVYESQDKDIIKRLNESGFDKDKLLDENRKVAVVKVGKNNALEFSNYFASDGNTFAFKTVIMSANDRIYAISTIGTNIDAEKITSNNTGKEEKIEDKNSKIIALNESDLDGVKLKKVKSDQAKTLKSFKTFVPTAKKQTFGYNDAITKKFVELPQNWFYVKGNFVESIGNGTVILAANYEEIKNAVKDVADYRTQNIDKDADMTNKQYEDCVKLTLNNINKAKLSLSMTMSNNELNGMFGNPLQTKLIADQLLRESFKRAKNFSAPYFNLNDYDYNTWFSETNGKVNISVLATLCNAFTYKGDFKSEFASKTNSGNFTFDFNKVVMDKANNVETKTTQAQITFKNAEIK